MASADSKSIWTSDDHNRFASDVATATTPALSITKQHTYNSILTTFQSGHGWTSSIQSGTPTFNLNDTSDYVLGSQAIRIDCPVNAAGYVSKVGFANMDVSGTVPKLWFKCEDANQLVTATLYLGDTNFTNFYLWTALQSGSNQWEISGEWVGITLPWSAASVTGVPSKTTITCARVRLNGGPNNASTIHFGGIAFVPVASTAFPNGVVSLRFDDGWTTQFSQARLKMDQYLFPGNAYIIRDQIGESTHTYMSLAELKQLQRTSQWDICHHADTIANHNLTWTGISPSAVEAEFQNGKAWLRDNGFKAYNHHAYPLGNYDQTTFDLARRYFSSAASIYEKLQETVPVADPHRLRIRNVQNTTTTASIQTDIDNAFTNGHWLILMFHRIETPADVATKYTPTNFATVVDYLATKAIPVRTVSDVLSRV